MRPCCYCLFLVVWLLVTWQFILSLSVGVRVDVWANAWICIFFILFGFFLPSSAFSIATVNSNTDWFIKYNKKLADLMLVLLTYTNKQAFTSTRNENKNQTKLDTFSFRSLLFCLHGRQDLICFFFLFFFFRSCITDHWSAIIARRDSI
jgi:hypothetical protein